MGSMRTGRTSEKEGDSAMEMTCYDIYANFYNIYMRNTGDRSITHKLAKMSFNQIFDLTAGVYFYIIQGLRMGAGIRRRPCFG